MNHQNPPAMDPVAEIQVPFSVVLAEKAFPLERILDLRPGAVLDLSRRHDSRLDVYVSGSRLGSGCAVDIGERLGLRLDRVDVPRERGQESAGG